MQHASLFLSVQHFGHLQASGMNNADTPTRTYIARRTPGADPSTFSTRLISFIPISNQLRPPIQTSVAATLCNGHIFPDIIIREE